MDSTENQRKKRERVDNNGEDHEEDQSASYWKAKYLKEKEAHLKLQKKFESAKDFIKTLMRDEHVIEKLQDDDPLFTWPIKNLEEEQDLAVVAYVTGHIELLADVPRHWRNDKQFLLNTLEELPPRLSEARIPTEIWHKVPGSQQDLDIWRGIIACGANFWELRKAPESLQSDEELLIKACKRKPSFFTDIPTVLQTSEPFLLKAIRAAPRIMLYFSRDTLSAFPEMVLDNLPYCFAQDVDDVLCYWLFESIPSDVRSRPSFAKTWFTAGGPFLSDCFPRNDRQIFLWIAENANSNICYRSFDEAPQILKADKELMLKAMQNNGKMVHHASTTLRDDKEIMLKAIENRSYCYARASDRLRNDFDIITTALGHDEIPFGTYDSFIQGVFRRQVAPEDRLIEVNLEVLEKLDLHNIFMTTILPCISLPSKNPSCSLTILNQGSETGLAYKVTLADYLGIPRGMQLRKYRRASQHLDSILDRLSPSRPGRRLGRESEDDASEAEED